MSVPDRNDIDDRYKLDRSQIFASDDRWECVRTDLLAELDSVSSRFDPPIETTDQLARLVDTVSSLYRRKQRLELYAQLTQTVTDTAAADARMRRYRGLNSEFESAIATVLEALSRTPDETLDALVFSLTDRTRFVNNLRRQACHRREPAIEAVIGEFEEALTAPDRTIQAVREQAFQPPEIERPDGETIAVTRGRYRTELSSPDRDYRRAVYEAYQTELGRFAQPLATAYAEKLKALSSLADVRGYESIRQLQLRKKCYPENGLESEFPTAVHDTMLATIRENLGPYHQAQRIRAEKLGVETLRPFDRRVSIAAPPEPEIPYERARRLITESVRPLGSEYQRAVRSFFGNDRIDVYASEGKRNAIAFCPSSIDDGAFIVMSYRDTIESLFTLTHELGHAILIDYLQDVDPIYASGPRATEEIPSVLHELLLVDHCIEHGGALAAHARNRLLRYVGGLLYGQAMYSAFKTRLAASVEHGEKLAADRLSSVFGELQTEFVPVVSWPEYAHNEWLNTALCRDPFHHYQYILGATGALTISDRLETGTATPADYREFLRNTGRTDAVTLFAELGLDVTAPEPYEGAIDAFSAYIDEL